MISQTAIKIPLMEVHMKEVLNIAPIILYFIVGMISLLMAYENLFAKQYLPFHEKAAEKTWNEIDESLKLVILSFLRLIGLGFLIVSILLIVFPVINYFSPNVYIEFITPIVAFIFCIGLFANNYLLFKQTKTDTPWKGSLYASIIIIIGIIISILS